MGKLLTDSYEFHLEHVAIIERMQKKQHREGNSICIGKFTNSFTRLEID